jgi:hypothetical protein
MNQGDLHKHEGGVRTADLSVQPMHNGSGVLNTVKRISWAPYLPAF